MEKPNYNCKLGILSRPDGSALLCEGDTVVMAGIYGPIEAKPQKVQMDKTSVECSYRPKSGLPGVQDRLHEKFIRNICETALVASLYPRSAVLITLQEMQNSGQLISCAVNSACLACLDSGIDMKCMFGAVTCMLTTSEELVLVAPISDKDIKASFVFVFDNSKGHLLASHTVGSFTREQLETAFNICREESKNVFKFFKEALLNNK